MDLSPNLNLPYLAAAQSQKHVTHNEALKAIDALVQLSVADRTQVSAPLTPAAGQRHIVASPAAGPWIGQENKIAAWQDGAWAFYPPQIGWLAWINAESALVVWSGTAWIAATAATLNPTPLIGVNATADTTNRFAVKSPASLFDNVGTSHRVKINKAGVADTASLVFQDGYAGRAELGLAGDDNLHVKVSADGATWREAIVIDRTTGVVSLPLTPAAGQVSADWAATSGVAQILNKPANVSAFTNDAGFQTAAQVSSAAVAAAAGKLTAASNLSDLASPASARTNLGLATVASSGSYTDLANKPSIPSAYTLPAATNASLGGVKVGTGLLVSADGTLAATGSGGAPGGANTQIQFNASGAFTGSPALTWDNTNQRITLNGSLLVSNGAAGLQNVGFGLGVLASAQSGSSSNVALGANALGALTTGNNNFAMGPNAGQSLTTGGTNVLIGQLAGAGLTTHTNNTAIGDHTLSLASGPLVLDNVAIGRDALRNLTNAQDNTAVGAAAGINLTTGAFNTALGCIALLNNTTGSNNIAVGYQAMLGAANSTASGNTAVGNNTLNAITTGTSNTAIGIGAAGRLTTGQQNVHVGQNSGQHITTSIASTLVGYNAGQGISTGNGNTVIGSNFQNINVGITTGSWNTIIGCPTGLPTTTAQSFSAWDGLGNIRLMIDSANNVAFGSQGSFGAGQKCVFVPNTTTPPTANPVGGGLIYVEAGALKYRGSSGTVTVIGPA